MREIKIITAFTGFPDGTDASERNFAQGQTVTDLPDDFADLIISKGHAVEAQSEAPTVTKKKDASK